MTSTTKTIDEPARILVEDNEARVREEIKAGQYETYGTAPAHQARVIPHRCFFGAETYFPDWRPWPGLPIPQFLNPPRSPRQAQTNEKYVGAVFILHHTSGHRVPDMLIAWNHPNCWSNREIVKDLQPVLVLGSGCGSGEPRDIVS
jgi:hypothetical protein